MARSADGRAMGEVARAAAEEAMNATAEAESLRKQLAKSRQETADAREVIKGIEPHVAEIEAFADAAREEADQLREEKEVAKREKISKRQKFANDAVEIALRAVAAELSAPDLPRKIADAVVKAKLKAYGIDKGEDQSNLDNLRWADNIIPGHAGPGARIDGRVYPKRRRKSGRLL
jgi:hypothetical protein